MNKTQISKEQLTSILDGLFGCETIANQIDDPQPIADPHVVATYNDLEGQFRFAISCDLPLANSLGAALTMIPPGGVEDAVAEGQVPANIAENLREVLSICSAVFAENEHCRIVLDEIKLPGQEMETDYLEKLESSECLLQINYELPRYPQGKISLLQIA